MGITSVGVDVGGTFTDFILIDGSGRLRTAKVPTTVDDRARGFLQGIHELGVGAGAIDWLVHGTTAGTNAVLERKAARCGLITTQGFRDAIEIGRRTRPMPYGLAGTFRPLIERCDRLEVRERIDAQGRVLVPLNEDDVRDAVERLRSAGVESIVVHFLHSYVNPVHEARCARIVRGLWPDENVVAGHEIVREVREFERGSTAAVHASIRPIVTRYLDRVQGELRAEGFRNELLVMQANGGMMAASVVGEHAVHTVMSGPAAGVLAAAQIARAAGIGNVITGDMGGTSFDVALIVGGEPVISAEKDLAYGVPVRIPMIDIHSIGAGGGSIARVDKAGMLRVGPESAGSFPGPIGYGRGGERPTITDANLLLGRLNPGSVTGSTQSASLGRIAQAFETQIGRALGMDALQAAAAVVRVAIDELAGAIRLISIEKGHDPRDFALMPFGGAGPLHAVAIARELGIPRVLVPRFPGLTSALGCILADVRHDYVRTLNRPFDALDAREVEQVMAQQALAGRSLLERERVPVAEVRIRNEVDVLYRGQSHVITLPVPTGVFDTGQVRRDLAAAYMTRFELSLPEMKPMLINVRTTIVGVREPVNLGIFGSSASDPAASVRSGSRRAFFDGEWVDADVYSREALAAHARIAGPAIVEQPDATLVVDPGAIAYGDRFGNLVIEVGAAA